MKKREFADGGPIGFLLTSKAGDVRRARVMAKSLLKCIFSRPFTCRVIFAEEKDL